MADEARYVGRVVDGRHPLAQRLGVLAKRAVDLFGAVLALMLLGPLMILVAVAIKIDSPGPVLFKQERVGSRRRVRSGAVEWEQTTFRVYKFRSMFHDVDQSVHEEYTAAWVEGTVAEADSDRVKFKLTGDDRITRVGRLIRRSSIDELPQLFNVIAGEMSLVGPRPVPTYEVAQYDPWQMERLHALPGMTGYWQVHGRGVVSFEEMMQMDIHYVRNQSVWMDLGLLLKTVPAVISGKGAE